MSFLGLSFKLLLATKSVENSLLGQKAAFLSDAQKHSENHQLSQGNKTMRAIRGRIATGYCLEPIAGDYFQLP